VPQIVCPQCRSVALRRSHARGLWEKIQRKLGWKGYRCRHCDWRGMIRVGLSPQEKRNAKIAALIISLLLLLYLSARLVFFLAESPWPFPL